MNDTDTTLPAAGRGGGRGGTSIGILVFAGLGPLAAEEAGSLGFKPGSIHRLANHDLVRVSGTSDAVRKLTRLRLAEDVFLMLGDGLPLATREDVETIDARLVPERIFEALRIKNDVMRCRKPARTTYMCFVKQDQDREVHRKTIAEAVNRGIGRRFGKWKESDPASLEFWGFYSEKVLFLGVRLSDESMRYRGREPVLRPGALRPTIAAAMMFAANPAPGERVVDPMCGSGTLLAEGLARSPGAVYAGGDVAPDAVEAARARLHGSPVTIATWDAAELPLADSTIDAIVCNLPFGRTFSTPEQNRTLYPAWLHHWAAKLKRGGRMVLLTSDTANLESACHRWELPRQVLAKVKVLGEWATIYRVQPST